MNKGVPEGQAVPVSLVVKCQLKRTACNHISREKWGLNDCVTIICFALLWGKVYNVASTISTRDKVWSIQLYVIKYVIDLRQTHGIHWMHKLQPKINMTATL
jgi:hypothetical protein